MFGNINIKNPEEDLVLNKKEKFQPVTDNVAIKSDTESISVEIIGTSLQEIVVEYFCTEAISEKEIKEQISSHYDESKNEFILKERDFSDIIKFIRINTPFNANVNIKSELGAIVIKKINGDIRLTNERGASVIVNSQGSLKGQNENGVFKIDDFIGDVNLMSENGLVKVGNLIGNANIKTENGSIKIEKAKGEKGYFTSENGYCKILKSQFPISVCQTENGAIYFESLLQEGKIELSTENGKVTAVIPENDNIKLTGKTENGAIKIGLDGEYETHNQGDNRIIKMQKGSQSLQVNVKTENGSIVIIDDPEAKIFKTFNRSHNSQWIDNILKNTEGYMRNLNIDGFNVDDLKRKIKESVMNFTNEGKIETKREINKVTSEIKNLMKSLKNGDHNFSNDMQDSIEKISQKSEKLLSKLQKKFFSFDSDEIKHEVNEQSRLKILQMLEDKKITVDEAERLLKNLGD